LIKLPDINVWIALAWDGHQAHGAANKWFQDLDSEGATFCRITQMGFLRLVTEPQVMGEDVLSNAQAWEAFRALESDPRITFSGESISPEPDWAHFSIGRSRKIWTDAYLAAFAVAHNFHIVSFDKDFESFQNLSKTVLAA
jgi:toxin-antitoxin system PIN domain toxin